MNTETANIDPRKMADILVGILPSLLYSELRIMHALLCEAVKRRTLEIQISLETLSELADLTQPTLGRSVRNLEAAHFLTRAWPGARRAMVYCLNLAEMEAHTRWARQLEESIAVPQVRKRVRAMA